MSKGIIIFLLIILIFIFFAHHHVPISPEVSEAILKKKIKRRVVISLTTTPKRISKIKHVIGFIMNQTVLPDIIHLNLPKVLKRDKSSFSFIPKSVSNNKLIQVNWVEDYGPITKLYPTLLLESDPETIIITIDDDMFYPKNMIETLYKYSIYYQDKVIVTSSDDFYNLKNKSYFEVAKDYLKGNIFHLVGSGSVAYQRKFFSSDLKDFILIDMDECKNCYLSDDLVISYHLEMRGIKKKMVYDLGFNILHMRPMEFGFGGDALGKQKRFGNEVKYRKCFEFLEKKFSPRGKNNP